jgi:SAM-dependent methyltransferase
LDIISNLCGKGARVLDVGCGFGHMTLLMQDKGLDAIGLEMLPVSFKVLKQLHSCFIRGTGCELPFKKNTFDAILSNGVLEHVGGYSEELKFLSECYRVLKEDGFLIVSVLPIKGSREWVVSKLGLKSLSWHERFYDEEAIKSLLLTEGFTIIDLERKEIVPDLLGLGSLRNLGVLFFALEDRCSATPIRLLGKTWRAVARKTRNSVEKEVISRKRAHLESMNVRAKGN